MGAIEIMSIPWVLGIPVMIFLGVIVPLWITYHYITVWMRMRAGGVGNTAASGDEVARLRAAATRLEERVASLESILDGEVPDWRAK